MTTLVLHCKYSEIDKIKFDDLDTIVVFKSITNFDELVRIFELSNKEYKNCYMGIIHNVTIRLFINNMFQIDMESMKKEEKEKIFKYILTFVKCTDDANVFVYLPK